MDDGDPAFKGMDCQYIKSMRSRIPLVKIDKLHSLERPPYQRDKEIIIKKTGSHAFQVSFKAIFTVSLTIMISSLVGMTMTLTGE
jgi:hypothetical protein